jgi:hypothetical protein
MHEIAHDKIVQRAATRPHVSHGSDQTLEAAYTALLPCRDRI